MQHIFVFQLRSYKTDTVTKPDLNSLPAYVLPTSGAKEAAEIV